MLLGMKKMIITNHAQERYKERVLAHRNINPDDLSSKDLHRYIRNEVNDRNIIAIVSFGDKFKFVFTKYQCEYRFEWDERQKAWAMLTVIRYKRVLAHLEARDMDDFLENGDFLERGIRTAIEIRKYQKELWDNNDGNEEMVSDLTRYK